MNRKNRCLLVENFILLHQQKNRGALKLRAEITPFEPDPGNAGEGTG